VYPSIFITLLSADYFVSSVKISIDIYCLM
jgi:hypothetical protein